MLKQQRSSAKFKKDYVAYLAIIIFFIVIFSEITFSIWLPMQMRSAEAWAEDSARQLMIDKFDKSRRLYDKALRKNTVDEAQPEMQLAKATLDHNARFLRNNKDKLSRETVKTLNDDYRRLFTQCRIFFDPDLAHSYYCFRNKLNTADTIKRLSDQLKVQENTK